VLAQAIIERAVCSTPLFVLRVVQEVPNYLTEEGPARSEDIDA
jgi:hypothetical protein